MEATEPLEVSLKFYDELLEADESNAVSGSITSAAPTYVDIFRRSGDGRQLSFETWERSTVRLRSSRRCLTHTTRTLAVGSSLRTYTRRAISAYDFTCLY